MKAILLKNVDKVGKAGDIVEVADGFFRNLLLPRKLAKPATTSAEKEVAAIKARAEEEAKKQEGEFAGQIEALKKEKLVVRKKANEEGHLFAAIHAEDIVAALKEKGFAGIKEEYVSIDPPIKTLGAHTITIRFPRGLEGSVEITVEKND